MFRKALFVLAVSTVALALFLGGRNKLEGSAPTICMERGANGRDVLKSTGKQQGQNFSIQLPART